MTGAAESSGSSSTESSGEYVTADEDQPKASGPGASWTATTSPSSGRTTHLDDPDGSPHPPSSSDIANNADELLSLSTASAYHAISIELVPILATLRQHLSLQLYILQLIAISKLALSGILIGHVLRPSQDESEEFEVAFLILAVFSSTVAISLFLIYRLVGGVNTLHFYRLYKMAKYFIVILLLNTALSAGTACLASIPLRPIFETGLSSVDEIYLALVTTSAMEMLLQILALQKSYQTFRLLAPYKAQAILHLLPPQHVLGFQFQRPVQHVYTRFPTQTDRRRPRRRRLSPVYLPRDPNIHDIDDHELHSLFRLYCILNLVLKVISLIQISGGAMLISADHQENTSIIYVNQDPLHSRILETTFLAIIIVSGAYTFLTSGTPLWNYKVSHAATDFFCKTINSALKSFCHLCAFAMAAFPLVKKYTEHQKSCSDDPATCPPGIEEFIDHIPYYFVLGGFSFIAFGMNLIRFFLTRRLYKLCRHHATYYSTISFSDAAVCSLESVPSRGHVVHHRSATIQRPSMHPTAHIRHH